jgi:predicted RNA-binding protein YlqC (UPF0109 family)
MKELLQYIVESLVDSPKEINITEVTGEGTIILELAVKPDDIGKVIGREGRTAWAVRAILNAAGGKVRKRIVLEILG